MSRCLQQNRPEVPVQWETASGFGTFIQLVKDFFLFFFLAQFVVNDKCSVRKELGAALSKHREHMEVAGIQKNLQIAKILGLNHLKSTLKTHNHIIIIIVEYLGQRATL